MTHEVLFKHVHLGNRIQEVHVDGQCQLIVDVDEQDEGAEQTNTVQWVGIS